MPITKGAIRKQRADKKKASINMSTKRSYKGAVASMRRKPTAKNLQKVFSQLDKAAKSNVLHKNTASRLKSRLSHLLAK
jgi:small subunit ribosomal protein S20